MKSGLLIKAVQPEGLAAALGLQPGERILAVNGEPVHDFLDWNFYASVGAQNFEPLQLEVLRNGQVLQVRVQGSGFRGQVERLFPASCALTPDPCLSWGITFEEPRFRHCGNRCIFCFVDQLPPGVRQSLCFKDEDFRLSFWHGNYITLTNLKAQDWERIFRQRLSPLYISVHATDDKIRRFLLGNPKAPAILPLLRRLVENKIALHTQVVICPGINDGKVLEKTLEDLSLLAPFVIARSKATKQSQKERLLRFARHDTTGILSLAVIPVGLTQYRQGLYPLRRVTTKQAQTILNQLAPWQKKLKKELGSPWVYASDELYLLAQHPIPPTSFYGDYPQIENGVGLLRSFWDLFALSKKVFEGIRRIVPIRFSTQIALVTGELFAPHLKKAVASLPVKNGLIEVVAVKNHYLGRKVTVAGLLAGRDILKALSKRTRADKFFIPSVMLKAEEEIFIDDLTLEGLRHELDKPVAVISSTGVGLVQALLREGGFTNNLT